MSDDHENPDAQEVQEILNEASAQEMQAKMREFLARTEKNLPDMIWERTPPPDPDSKATFYKGSCPTDGGQGPIAVCRFLVGDRESADGAVCFGSVMIRLLPNLAMRACELAEAQLRAAGK